MKSKMENLYLALCFIARRIRRWNIPQLAAAELDSRNPKVFYKPSL